jgi:hypothetical protein
MHEFNWEIVKECTFFGIKVGIPGLLNASIMLFSLTLLLNNIPQYTTFAALFGMAISLVAMVDRMVYQDFTPIFTEAYQNGKKKLCEYYNAHCFRFFFINTGFTLSIILSIISVFGIIFEGFGLEYYLLTVPFLIPSLLRRMTGPYRNYLGSLLIAASRPTQLMIMNLIFEGLRLIAWFLTVQVFKIQDLGFGGVIYVIVLTEFPVEMIKIVVYMVYVDRSIFKLKFMPWQTFGVPIISTLTLYGTFETLKFFLLDKMWQWSFIGTLIVGFIIILLLVFIFYFPLTVLLGGWDDNSIRDLRAGIKMSGPSKPIVTTLTKLVFVVLPHSKLHNKYKYDETDAFREIQELANERDINREKLLKESQELL